MNTSEYIPWDLIQKALKKSLTEDEQKKLEEWLSESEANRKLYKQISLAWNVARSEHKEFVPDEEKAWNRIVSNIGIQDPGTNFKSLLQNRKLLFFLRNAAAILFIPLLIFSAVLLTDRSEPTESSVISAQTEQGQRSKFLLQDSTQIWLNSNSRLDHTPDDKSDVTRLKLKGEAYVEKPPKNSGDLIVSTSHKDVRVTGTAFNLRAYPEEDYVQTVLVNGQVELHVPDNHQEAERVQILEAGQRADYDKSKQTLQISESDTYEYTAWHEGVLAFRNVTFDELTTRLENWYNVRIIYDSDQFDDTEYSGVFRNQETIDQVFNTLQATTPFEYRIDNNRIIIE